MTKAPRGAPFVPAVFALALWRQGDRHGATVPAWWLGENCWNISVYVRDALAQELPLYLLSIGAGWCFLRGPGNSAGARQER